MFPTSLASCYEHHVRSCDDRMIQKVHQTIGRHGDGSMEAPALQLVKYICKVTMETNPRLVCFYT